VAAPVPRSARASLRARAGRLSELLIALAACAAVYAGLVLALVALGRRGDARAFARFVPDCALLFRRLAADPRVPRRRKLVLVPLVAYLALPLDVVPDFIPVAGQLDDAILVALALRWLLRGGGPELVRSHWPGPPESLAVMLRLAGAPRAGRVH
jgi:uncharacterized membrane protein YkvA (DUF1232 family)